MELVAILVSLAFCWFGFRRYSDATDMSRQAQQKIIQANTDIAFTKQQLQAQAASNQSQKQQLEDLRKKIQEEQNVIDEFITTKISQYPVIAKMLADYHASRDEAIAAHLINKKRPALTAAEQVRILKEEKEELRTKLLSCSWELESIYSILPAFREIKNVSIENAISTLQSICMNITLQQASENAKRKLQEADAYYNEQKISIEEQRATMEKNAQLTTQLADQYWNEKTREAKAYYNERIQTADTYYQEKISSTMNECQIAWQSAEEAIRKQKQEAAISIQKITQEEKQIITDLLNANVSKFPVVTLAIADLRAEREALNLRLADQKRPAPKATEQAKQLQKEKRLLLAENLAYKYELHYLHSLLPWLEDIEDEPMEANQNNDEINTEPQNDDAAGYWLSPEEYRSLPVIEKYQLALNRYMKRNKSNAEIGRDYERYVGYQYELEGYKVTYYGAERGLEDLGRDLVCVKGKKILVVQCKCWSNKKQKIIHEKHINQLYGTTIKYYIDCCTPQENWQSDGSFNLFPILQSPHGLKITPVFVSTVPYSETALKFASALGVQCRQMDMGKYPMIKCNIGKTGERIYHLPFDQQYDKVVIDKKAGECYAMTVQEAEDKGFRRAMRWRGNSP